MVKKIAEKEKVNVLLSRVSIPTYAERDIVKALRLSVRHTLLLYQNECTYRQILSTHWRDSSFIKGSTKANKIRRGLLKWAAEGIDWVAINWEGVSSSPAN